MRDLDELIAMYERSVHDETILKAAIAMRNVAEKCFDRQDFESAGFLRDQAIILIGLIQHLPK